MMNPGQTIWSRRLRYRDAFLMGQLLSANGERKMQHEVWLKWGLSTFAISWTTI